MEDVTQNAPRTSRGKIKFFPGGHIPWVLSIFLIGLSAKFLMILQANSPLPYLDQWDGEAADAYVPYFNHTLTLLGLIKPHNEHRIFFTRVYDLILLLVNGQWDSTLQMALNAILHCGAIAGLGWWVARKLGRQCWPWIWLPLVLAVALPFGWENALWGFQSQFYFLLIFSLLTMRWMGLGEPLSKGWMLGVVCAVLCLFTMASGFIAVVAATGLSLMEILKDRRAWRKQMPNLIVCGVLVVAGLLLKADVQRHHILQAHSIKEFVLAFGNSLAWPWCFHPWMAPFNLFIFVMLLWVFWRAPKDRPMNAERMALMIGFWAILQSAAASYARGSEGAPPAWRYMDTISLFMLANWLGMVAVLKLHRAQLRLPRAWRAGFAVWALICLAGLWQLTTMAYFVYIPRWSANQNVRLQNARAFMATDSEHAFDTDDPGNLAFPDVPQLVSLLRSKELRSRLPACIREPLKVVPDGASDGAFVANGFQLTNAEPAYEKSWGSFSAAGVRARGTFVSQPIKPGAMPYLEIPVAGDLGEPGLSLELVEVSTGKTTPVKASHRPGPQWMNLHVKAPSTEFKLVAHDDSDTKWFAFKGPREMGWLSFWTLKMLGAWKCFLVAGAVCLLIGIVEIFRFKEQTPSTRNS